MVAEHPTGPAADIRSIPVGMAWSSVTALLTDDERTRARTSSEASLWTVDPDPPQAVAGYGLLAGLRDKGKDRMAAAQRDLTNSVAALLQAAELPSSQAEVLRTVWFAMYRTVCGVRSKAELRALMPKFEPILGAALQESARRAAAAPGAFRSSDEVASLCKRTSARIFDIAHTARRAHLAWELHAGLATVGHSALALPATMTLHAFGIGMLVTLSTGIAELYGTASYLSNAGYSGPADGAIEIVARVTGQFEQRVVPLESVKRWIQGAPTPASKVARQWLARSLGTGIPFVGKRLQAERADLLAAMIFQEADGALATAMD